MTYPGTSYSSDIIFPRKHYYYDGMGNRVAIVTQDVNTSNGNNFIQNYCNSPGIPYQGCEDCRKQIDFTVDTYYYEAGGKLLYKNKFSNHTNVTYVCSTTENDVEWYVYGSASDGRVATVYPRFKIQDNEHYDNNFEDSPPNQAVAYNTEMVSNTFTAVALSASITGIETYRHLGEKRYEIKDHLGNVRAVVSDIKNAENYSLSASSWKFLADVRSMSNYYPYGSLISAGSWSGSSYNYGYNGMLKEAIGDDISHTHFRNLSVGDFVGWWSPDPLEFQFPSYSPYASMGNNPIRYKDSNGDIITDALKKAATNDILERLNSMEKNLKSRYSENDQKYIQKMYKISEVRNEIQVLEESVIIYDLNQNINKEDIKIRAIASISYDVENERVVLNVYMEDEFDVGAKGHEIKHMFQFEVGKLSFNGTTGTSGWLYDVYDEAEAFERDNFLSNDNKFYKGFSNDKDYKSGWEKLVHLPKVYNPSNMKLLINTPYMILENGNIKGYENRSINQEESKNKVQNEGEIYNEK